MPKLHRRLCKEERQHDARVEDANGTGIEEEHERGACFEQGAKHAHPSASPISKNTCLDSFKSATCK
ncbi:hypothetical protein E2562_003241 [Oryza meyeriana var. granulata]|uniref:Uncharacterized protein n=1 Tax=Oryza meyeriana var. granulata TaxID=110450 RepID=A0A6G1EUW5_9ORYZ|nr:hypothetical protein E2562_003241 [Oryza meyeriana var. granulata]